MRTSAARRAEERVPLDAVLVAYHVGGRIGWHALVDEAHPDEYGALIAAGARVLYYVQQVTAAVASAYLEEQQTIYGEERDARRALASALLTGEPPEGLAARLGVHLAPSFLVVAFQLGSHPDEREGGVGGAIAARRKVRRAQAALDDVAGEPVLSLLEPGGGSALLPLVAGASADVSELVQQIVLRLTAAAYSLDGRKWVSVFPADGLFDGRSKAFRFTTEALTPGTHVVVLRVRDAAGNVGAGDVVFTVTEKKEE